MSGSFKFPGSKSNCGPVRNKNKSVRPRIPSDYKNQNIAVQSTRNNWHCSFKVKTDIYAKIWNRMTASILKQDPNTKWFKWTLIYFNTNAQYANLRGNPLYQVMSWQSLSCQQSSKYQTSCKNSNKTRSVFFFHLSSFLTVYLLFKCHFVAW